MDKLRIIVGGYIGLYPTGGATWDYIQYVLGLRDLGHDVYYLEDTAQYPVYQAQGDDWNDASGCIEYLRGVMDHFAIPNRWVYRDVVTNKLYGMSERAWHDVVASTDILINISCSTYLREEYSKIPVRVLIDSDPMFTQIQYAWDLANDPQRGGSHTKELVDAHTHLFSFGENIGEPDCRIPTHGLNWLPTRQPVCLDNWPQREQPAYQLTLTSVMNWSGRSKLIFENETWGQKDVEFERFATVPKGFPNTNFSVVVNRPLNKESSFDRSRFEELGWHILSPDTSVADLEQYRNFVSASSGEFSVAKETYVRSGSGWFSGRTACYLATGRPAVTQDTLWSKYIPSGRGVLAFRDLDSAVDAVTAVIADPGAHSSAAREIACEYFDSRKVLASLLERLN